MKWTWEERATLFEGARALPPAERARFLAERCAADEELRLDVESLLEQDAAAGEYLEVPPALRPENVIGPVVGTIIGDFRIVDRLGRGGMGQVFEAEQSKPRRRVALKVLPALSADPETRRRFAQEADLLARMNHPAIAQVFATGVEVDMPYFALELVRGASTITEYARERRLTPREAIVLFRRVCDAVAHGHAQGVVHRDLKPGNILVDGDGAPKLIDFGVARALDLAEGDERRLTRTTDVIGTLQYLSPEQAARDGGEITTQADVHGLGLVLYEILCGRPAHAIEGLSLPQALRTISEEPVLLARRVRPDLPPEVEWILAKALETDRKRRYTSVVEFDRDLERFLAHEPLAAGPRSRAYELKLWVRRHPTSAAVGGVVAVALVAVVALALSALARQREVFRLADAERLRDLERRADVQLWPATPERADAMEAWLGEAREVAANLDTHRATLAALRARALPRTPAEVEAQAAGSPRAGELASLERQITWAGRALKRRNEPAAAFDPVPEHTNHDGIQDGNELNRIADAIVNPDNPRTEDPAVAAALALQALEFDDCDRGGVLDTLAWAYFALGDDETAADYSAQAIAEGPAREPILASAERLASASALARSPAGRARAAEEIAELERRAADLARTLDERRSWKFADPTDGWWHERIEDLVADIEAFVDPVHGVVEGTSPEHGLGVAPRLALARGLEQRTLVEPAEAWRSAIAAIASTPRYHGLAIRPQVGLVPLGADPRSGLQEFADVASGMVPTRGADGRLTLDGETAVVFVLIPSGSFVMGAQAADPSGPQYDPSARDHESPPRRMELDAYFFAKYELDQGQWRRLTGSNPSTFSSGDSIAGERIDDRHPVESVTWSSCTEVLARVGWRLPTEAQWEYAARADTTTIWWTGSDVPSLQGAANICDRHAREYEVIPTWRYDMAIDDGRYYHAPVGSYRANPFGLHDVCGNVMEWCRDLFAPYTNARSPGDGFVLHSDENRNVVRDGGYENNDASSVRSARRGGYRPEQVSQSLGVRPARPIAD